MMKKNVSTQKKKAPTSKKKAKAPEEILWPTEDELLSCIRLDQEHEEELMVYLDEKALAKLGINMLKIITPYGAWFELSFGKKHLCASIWKKGGLWGEDDERVFMELFKGENSIEVYHEMGQREVVEVHR